MAGLARLQVEAELAERPSQALHLIAGAVEIYLPLAGMVDLAGERTRIEGELKAALDQRARLEALLANDGFVSRARPDVVERERGRLVDANERLQKLEAQLAGLDG